MKDRRYFLEIYLRRVSVAMALWRCYECERFARDRIPGPVLDVGCGDGFFAKTVFGHPLDAGIDLNPREIDRARRLGAYDRAILGSATDLPLDKGSFRSVISNCVLEHIPDIDAALAEISRVLRPGGRLFITVPSERYNDRLGLRVFLGSIGLKRLGKAYLDAMNRVFKHHHVDDAVTWTARLRRAGLKVEICDYIIPEPAFRAYEWWLPPSLFSKVFWLLFGRWVIFPRGWVVALVPRLLKRVLAAEGREGAGYYIRARKTGTPRAAKRVRERSGRA